MQSTLVILAAGKGSRYGGPKQFAPVGPSGESMVDYTVHDAWHAGFDRVVLVLAEDTEEAFVSALHDRYAKRIAVTCVRQRLDLQKVRGAHGRSKPWGTAHALLSAEPEVSGMLGVVNADDHYGAASFVQLAEFLRGSRPAEPPVYGLVSFWLRETLSQAGPVNRGLCRCDNDGWLIGLDEVRGIKLDGNDGQYTGAHGEQHRIPGDRPVSMNMWGFSPEIFPQLRALFDEFLVGLTDPCHAEFQLPTAVGELVWKQLARVQVLGTTERWCGLTHDGDRDHVAEMLREAVAEGRYTTPLWD
jgi:hypothetical protein